jgi:hypothetical protein
MIIFDLLPIVTDAIAVQQGIVVKSGNTYLHQVLEAIGRDTEWTRLLGACFVKTSFFDEQFHQEIERILVSRKDRHCFCLT